MQRVCRAIVDSLKVNFGYFSEYRGIFSITDHDDNPVPGVRVSYRVGDGDWIPCGESTTGRERPTVKTGSYGYVVNFMQLNTIVYEIGDTVAWKFSKKGYLPVTITRYTADQSFDETHNTIVLEKR